MQIIGYTESGMIRAVFDGEDGESFTPDDMGNRHRQMIAEWEAEGNTIPPFVPPAPIVSPSQPFISGSIGLQLEDGLVSKMELPSNIEGMFYETGWLSVYFQEPQEENSYLIFVQTDKPARVEQFKSGGSFELVFTDPGTGDAVDLGRIDLQILKVR